MILLIWTLVVLQDAPQPKIETPPSMAAGPMRVELTTIRERRSRNLIGDDNPSTATDMTLQFRLRGERLKEIARFGRPIFTQLSDSTGKALVAPAEYSDSERNYTGRQLALPNRLERAGLVFATRTLAPDRKADLIASIRGTIRVIYATRHESIYIDNPRQYQGKTIDHPRLREYGIEIFVLPAGEPSKAQIGPNDVALRFEKGEERIHNVLHCDPWLKQLRSRAMAMRDDQGRDCIVYKTEAELTEEHSMVIEFYPVVDDVRVPIEFDDVKLP